MSGKCAAYWRAMGQGKDCGVPETRQAKRKQDAYINGIVPDLVSMGAKEEDVLELFKYSNASGGSVYSDGRKTISLVALKRSSPIRRKMLDFIFQRVVAGEVVLTKDLCDNGFSRDEWTPEMYEEHYGFVPSNKRTFVFCPPRVLTANHHKGTIKATLKRPIPNASTRLSNGQTASISVKKNILAGLCTSGQIGILQDMNLAGFGDDEYTAFCIALKWAWERLESEKKAKGGDKPNGDGDGEPSH